MAFIDPPAALSLAKTLGVLSLHPFNNVTGLLRKPLISKSIVILARDRCRERLGGLLKYYEREAA